MRNRSILVVSAFTALCVGAVASAAPLPSLQAPKQDIPRRRGPIHVPAYRIPPGTLNMDRRTQDALRLAMPPERLRYAFPQRKPMFPNMTRIPPSRCPDMTHFPATPLTLLH